MWLGDGSAAAGRVTKPDIELFDLVSARGYSYSPPAGSDPAKCPTRTIYGLQKQLREAGLLGHKHIPDDYLRSSIGQRLDLIRGLMDTDGTWNRVRTGIAHPGNQPKTITGGFMFARLRYLLDFTAWALTIAFVPFLGVVIYLAGGGR